MMHKAWRSTGEVPYCFSRLSVKFQGHTGQKIADFDPNWAFPDCNSSLTSPMALKWCTKLMWYRRGALLFSKVIRQISLSHRLKNRWFESNLRLLGGAQLSYPSDLPCLRSSAKFQVRMGQKIADFDPNWTFPDCNFNLNLPMDFKWCTKLDVL